MKFRYLVYWTIVLFVLDAVSVIHLFAAPETALNDYLKREEPAYTWSIRSKKEIDSITLIDARMVSQTWRDIVWTHQVQIVAPKEFKDTQTALLFITGGRNENGEPRWADEKSGELKLLANIADKTGSPIVILRQVPNQPLYDGKLEDDLISHTFVNYLETRDETWPLLLPMVKSAVKAMDTVTALFRQEYDLEVTKFVVSGGSKRGWTTWLTGASDPRVVAIAPMVIDTLNMKRQMDYQLEWWGEYSEQIEDYTRKGIQQRMDDPEGKDLLRIVDPYSYRDRLALPKLIFIGTNDPYWPVDAIKFYWNDLPGDKYIHYVPNAGHDLGDGKQAIQALASFFANCALGNKQPSLAWNIENNPKGFRFTVKPDPSAKQINLWMATSSDRDFRNNLWQIADKKRVDKPEIVFEGNFPKKGYLAIYAETIYPSPIGDEYSKSTRVYVMDQTQIIGK